MKKIILLFILLFNIGKETSTAQYKAFLNFDKQPRGFVKQGYVKTKLQAFHSTIKNTVGSLGDFTKFINTLDADLLSIPYMRDYIQTCIPANNNENQDSVYYYFNKKVYLILDSSYDEFMQEYEPEFKLLDSGNILNDLIKELENNLDACGLEIKYDDGYAGIAVQTDYFYESLKNRVSDDLKEMLEIQSEEDFHGFIGDGVLTITFDELYKRVKRWEKFLKKYPNSFSTSEGNYYYEIYFSIFLTGADNTNLYIFDSSHTILPEIKTLYQKAMNDEPESRTALLMKDYYRDLESRHFHFDYDRTWEFLHKNNLQALY